MNARRLWLRIGLSVIAAGPTGGFLFGLLRGGDPDPNPIGRVVYACRMAVLTPWHAGFPPNHAAVGGQSHNVWPYMAGSALLIFGCLAYRARRFRVRGRPVG